jgi:hypothetical protein
VTWKADGTRYVMLLLKWGTYLIDRSGEVCPAAAQPAAAAGGIVCLVGLRGRLKHTAVCRDCSSILRVVALLTCTVLSVCLQVRRVHMRFPSRIPSADRKPGGYPLGPPHDFTILDGEHVFNAGSECYITGNS